MSRQPTWDLACSLQGEMFDAVAKAGGLSVQLAYFRGLGEFQASAFVARTDALKQLMTGIDCRGGHTQIGKVLAHALAESKRGKVGALVYIGDAMEERADDLAAKAGELGLHGVPVFVFQEGRDGVAERTFKEIARISKGAWFRFDRNSAATLARLLVGGRRLRFGRPQGAGGARPRRRPADDRVVARRTQMSVVIEILAGFVVAALLLVAFLRTSPTAVASAIRMLGPVLLGIAGFAVVGIGKAAPAASWSRRPLPGLPHRICCARRRSPGPAGRWCARRRSKWSSTTKRARWKGVVLAGRSEGKMLGKMGEAELIALYRELGGDFESRQLLEAYLDSRFPVWRQNAKAHDGNGLGGAPGSGPMTKEEAYKVLGLETGAAAADVRKAHRRLMQRLHPDLGGSSFLAARINEAKDVLLSDHH